MTFKNLQSVLRARAVVALGATALIVLAGPALAQSIDLSPVQTLLQGIVDAITGPLGIVIGTLALIGVFLSWLFGILDFRQALTGEPTMRILCKKTNTLVGYLYQWNNGDVQPAWLNEAMADVRYEPLVEAA